MNGALTFNKSKKLAAQLVIIIFLIIVLIFTLFPLLVTFFGAFKTNAELSAGATILPEKWQFSNFVEAWKQANFALFTWNSLYTSTIVTIGTIIVASMSAYAVDRKQFRGKKLYVGIQAFTMFVSIGAVVLKPQFEMMVALNLHTTLWGVILILIAAHAQSFFIIIGFMRVIPKDLDEAALIDGCNFFSVYWRVVLPLLRPGLAVAALFAFRQAWNEYILPLVFTLNSPHLQTLTVGLANLRYGTTAATQTHLMLAGACLSIIPILIVYIFANKSFMQVTAGSVKG